MRGKVLYYFSDVTRKYEFRGRNLARDFKGINYRCCCQECLLQDNTFVVFTMMEASLVLLFVVKKKKYRLKQVNERNTSFLDC